MLRTTIARTARATFAAPPSFSRLAAPLAARTMATSACRMSEGEGIGKKEPIRGTDPISARAKGVGKAVKGVAEGMAGLGEKAVGKDADRDDSAHQAGADSRDVLHQEIDKGKKKGLAKKGEEQGAL
ncbi:hypothetical protein JCM8547_004816 [Rhodosporidiobolus lusitaniae]